MENMIEFCTQLLNAIVVFLASEPIIYLFGLLCLGVLISAFSKLYH